MNPVSAEHWENPVKARLREGLPVLGITITTNSVETAAQAASLGFDFLWIEMEHSPVTLETLRNIILATRGLKAVPFARSSSHYDDICNLCRKLCRKLCRVAWENIGFFDKVRDKVSDKVSGRGQNENC